MHQSPIYAFVDLDDSLFQIAEKCTAGPLLPAAIDREGKPLFYHTPQQINLLDLFGQTPLIPVTGRNFDALRRVVSPRFTSYRITSHGALIRGSDDRPLTDWEEQLKRGSAEWSARLDELLARAQEAIAAAKAKYPLRAQLIHDAGMPTYVAVRGEPEELEILEECLRPHWPQGKIQRSGSNLAFLPPYADKAAAVRYLIRQLSANQKPTPLFLGLGDSLADLPFLKLCHYAIVPRNSQIQRQRW